MKVGEPIFDGGVAFAHIKAARDMTLHVTGASHGPRGFLQTGALSSSVLRGCLQVAECKVKK